MNKPSTPQTGPSSNMSNSAAKGFGLGNQIGTIKRQNSNKPRNDNIPSDRPSTAPSKNDNNNTNNNNYQPSNSSKVNYNNSMKRQPSPVIKCIMLLTN